ncbi:hypothetical protein Pla52o_42520 [Novipirellula galeiformis]|uniref:Uncharacterized protein n=1 Tax=Novipirellula galeiformis TaxID=2528004 RepID=A0A5C6CAH6_9BACT|nr:hypothetical protein [Novipirellula galeiformis]TWU21218.1 hypothetical protein Pla52o_42520 [Novipirellula galeiformis]
MNLFFRYAKNAAKRFRKRLLSDETLEIHQRVVSLEAMLSRVSEDMTRQRRDLRCLMQQLVQRPKLPLPDIREDGYRHDEVFILGSSSSMLELDIAQKNAIQASVSISMNRYLVFWDLVGIWPKYHFLADSLGVGWQVFRKSLETIRSSESREQPVMLLESDFQLAVPVELPAIFFDRDDRSGDHREFAESLDQPMFFRRGSLTSLLNLIYVLRLAPRIRLVGVDLNRPGTFFEAKQSDPSWKRFFNPWDEVAKSQGVHATVADMSKAGWGQGSVLDEFGTLIDHLNQRGVSVSCTSPDSLLVEKGFCTYDPICTD